MPTDQAVTIYFHRDDGESERVPLAHGTISEAVTAITRCFMSARVFIRERMFTETTNSSRR